MSITHHTRSVSLPSSIHPTAAHFDEVLSRLKSSEDRSSSSICKSLSGLQILHECVTDLIHMPENQQVLALNHNEKHTDEIFEGSLRALDFCGVAKEFLSGSKGCIHELQSILRRKVGEANLVKEITDYMNQGRNARKAVQKAFRDSTTSIHHSVKDNESSVSILGKLKQVDTVTVSVLQYLLTSILGSKGPVTNKWSLVSKLMQSTRLTSEESTANELSKVETMLQTLLNKKSITLKEMQNLQTHLTDVEQSIQHLEEGLESLFRRLIKTRVSLLNTLNH